MVLARQLKSYSGRFYRFRSSLRCGSAPSCATTLPRSRSALAKSARASSNVVDVPDWISPSFDKINETAQIQVNRRERPDGSNALDAERRTLVRWTLIAGLTCRLARSTVDYAHAWKSPFRDCPLLMRATINGGMELLYQALTLETQSPSTTPPAMASPH